MTKKKLYIHTKCQNCNSLLGFPRKVTKRFCSHDCGVAWRTKNVYRYKYTFRHRSESPHNFMKVLLSKKRDARSELDIQFLTELWDKQKGLCAISGLPMTYKAGEGKVNTNVSIDQIIPGMGYTKDNVQLVTYSANLMKGTLTMAELYTMCEQILNYSRSQD